MGYYTGVENEGATATDMANLKTMLSKIEKVSKEHIQYYFNLVKGHKWQD